VGDSHLYLFHEGMLTQLSTDHVYATELDEAVREGRLSQAEADCHPERRSLTSYVGVASLTEIDVGTGELQVGDRLLLCSDGLYGSLSNAEMASELRGDPQPAAEVLITQALAKRHAHQDNLTAVVMAWETEERLQQQRQQQQQQKADLPTAPTSARMRIGVAIVLAWILGFAMGRSWEMVRSTLTNSEQMKEGSQLSSSPAQENVPHATEQDLSKEGRSHE